MTTDRLSEPHRERDGRVIDSVLVPNEVYDAVVAMLHHSTMSSRTIPEIIIEGLHLWLRQQQGARLEERIRVNRVLDAVSDCTVTDAELALREVLAWITGHD